MQGRSRMAALAGIAGAMLLLSAGLRVHAEDKIVVKEVSLELRIAGLGRDGCDIEIKPGHPGCRFEKITQHVDSDGKQTVVIKDVECRNANRDCSFAITVKEPGQPDSTVRRGFRVAAPDPDRPAQSPSFACFINSPSKVARAAAERTRR
ncbi:MAG: hypothetical protein P4L84_21770 [Isosphaeraceae bacterium]|nr:hypothetical protein [Isosphaeraceae bacterium]